MRRHIDEQVFYITLALTLALLQGSAWAQPAKQPPPKAQVRVAAIAATATDGDPDPALRQMVPVLKRTFPDYQGFKLVSSTTVELARGATEVVPLPNGKDLKVGYLGPQEGYVKLHMDIKDKLSTTVRVEDGGTFFQAGMAYEGGILILAITAKMLP